MPLLPAASTTVTPARIAVVTAASRSGASSVENEQLITLAPLRVAYRIAFAAYVKLTSPVGWSFEDQPTRSGLMRRLGPTPALPMWLFASPAMTPATCVPCPEKSLGSLSASRQSSPAHTLSPFASA